MKTKAFFSAILGLMVVLISSCQRETIEYRNVNRNEQYFSFKIKTKKNVRTWGLISQAGESLPCIYDTLWSASLEDYDFETLILGRKDGKNYAWTIGGMPHFEGRNFEKIVPREHATNNSALGNNYHEAHFSDGIIFFYLNNSFEFGPAQYLFGAEKSLIYQKNGKWGIIYESDMKEIAPCIYDGAIEVCGGRGAYWIVKKGGQWTAIDRDGQYIDKSAQIPKLLKLPIVEPDRIANPFARRSGTYQRTGGENYGYIRFSSGVSGLMDY